LLNFRIVSLQPKTNGAPYSEWYFNQHLSEVKKLEKNSCQKYKRIKCKVFSIATCFLLLKKFRNVFSPQAPGLDYRINVGRLAGGSLASSYGGDINIGEVDERSHVRDFGWAGM
jgi:hypothetical protein